MNAKCEEQISHLRRMGESYGKIAEKLGISANTVKSYCQRHKLGGKMNAQISVMPCPCCGGNVSQAEHHKTKRFCSDACRAKWWSKHRHLIDRCSAVSFCCRNCGKEFIDYKSTERKYCCHECYIADRFGNTNNECRAVPRGKAVSSHDEPCGSNAETGPYFGG